MLKNLPALLLFLDKTALRLRGFLIETLPRVSCAPLKLRTCYHDIPLSAFNEKRKQYNAELILRFLLSKFEKSNEILVAITSRDIYVKGMNFVFGLAQLRGKACVASICRLNPAFWGEKGNEKLFRERVLKEVLHELYHVIGLEHCNNYCVMRFSNSIWEVDAKPLRLCSTCKRKLKSLLKS